MTGPCLDKTLCRQTKMHLFCAFWDSEARIQANGIFTFLFVQGSHASYRDTRYKPTVNTELFMSPSYTGVIIVSSTLIKHKVPFDHWPTVDIQHVTGTWRALTGMREGDAERCYVTVIKADRGTETGREVSVSTRDHKTLSSPLVSPTSSYSFGLVNKNALLGYELNFQVKNWQLQSS